MYRCFFLKITKLHSHTWTFTPQSTYRDRVEIGTEYLPSQALSGSAHHNLYVMVDIEEGGWACTLHPHAVWANFSIVMECTPECCRCYSVYFVIHRLAQLLSANTETQSRSPLPLSSYKVAHSLWLHKCTEKYFSPQREPSPSPKDNRISEKNCKFCAVD